MSYRQRREKTGGSGAAGTARAPAPSSRASLRSPKGLSSAPVRPDRWLPVSLTLILLALASGCAEKAARLTGNERLLRGELGTTLRSDTLVDRDTYVTSVTGQVRGGTLLVGRLGTYEARALFREGSWSLPEPTAVIDTVRFRIEFDARVNENLPIAGTPFSLRKIDEAWDTTLVAWPGPVIDSLLGTGPDDVAPLTIDLGPAAILQLRAWAADTLDVSGFALTLDSGTGVRGFLAGTGRFEVVSHPTNSTTRTTHTSRLSTDLTIHAPAAPASGSETELLLGGLFGYQALLRAPVAPPPAGFSINQATFVAHIVSPAFPTDESVEVQAFRIRNPWSESATADSGLGLDTAVLASLGSYRVRASGDSIAIPIPISVAREWSLDPTTNHGILVRVPNGFLAPEIRLASRESAQPPVLRISTTTPPPGRF